MSALDPAVFGKFCGCGEMIFAIQEEERRAAEDGNAFLIDGEMKKIDLKPATSSRTPLT